MGAEALPERFTVRVTWAEICRGMRGDGDFCPIALALRRQTENCDWSVNYMLAYARTDQGVVSFRHDGRSFIQMFDRLRWFAALLPRTVTLVRHHA